jgi:putative membrane protein
MPTGRQATLIIWFVGMSALIGLTVWSGADLVGGAIVSAGWATALVVVARIVAVAGAGAGWWLLFPRELRPSVSACVLLRFVREATNALLPLAQIGGDFIGARCLTLHGVRGMVAAASVIVDVLMQAATQLVFAIVGLVLLVVMAGNELVAWPIAIGVALAIPALAGFFMIQGERGQRLAKKLLSLVAGDRHWQAFGAIDDLFVRLGAFHGYRRGLLRSFFWHLASWFVGATEVWIVLHFMGYPVTFEQAVIVESLLHAVRGAAFAVPGALGAQEGGLIVLCAMFGVPPEAAIALSLVKRIPDLVIGVPGLIAWQTMEGWHFHSRRRPRPAAGKMSGLEEQ